MIDQNDVISAAISAFLLPPLVGFLVACNAEPWVKAALASLFSILLGLASCLLANQFDPANIATSLLAVALAAGASYKLITGEIAKKAQTVGPQLGAPKDASS